MDFASGRLLALFERLIFVSGSFSAPLLYCRQNYNQGVKVILPVLNLNHSIFAPSFVNAFFKNNIYSFRSFRFFKHTHLTRFNL